MNAWYWWYMWRWTSCEWYDASGCEDDARNMCVDRDVNEEMSRYIVHKFHVEMADMNQLDDDGSS